MKIAVIGATGRAGSQIVRELASRGHQVTAIARHVEQVPALPGVTAKVGDAGDPAALAALLKGHDAVVSAVRFQSASPEALIGAVRAAGVPRYLVVGGAASLEAAPGKRLFDAPGFPDAYKGEAAGGIAFLAALKATQDIDWTFLSPSAAFDTGPRTGKFRLGGDGLLTAADGTSRISFADYAIAMADEIEHPAHSRQRFTVGY